MNKEDYQYFDKKFDLIHKRINDLSNTFSGLDKKVNSNHIRLAMLENGIKSKTVNITNFFWGALERIVSVGVLVVIGLKILK